MLEWAVNGLRGRLHGPISMVAVVAATPGVSSPAPREDGLGMAAYGRLR
jgi:hypothetical protein